MKGEDHTIRITVHGNPVGKPRMTQRDKWARRPAVMRYRTWADTARAELLAAGGIPEGAVVHTVNWSAYIEPPKSWSKKKREYYLGEAHQAKPDRDNIDKAVLDSLFREDQGVAYGHMKKMWGSPARLEIEIVYSFPRPPVPVKRKPKK